MHSDKDIIVSKAFKNVRDDIDISEYASEIVSSLADLLDAVTLADDGTYEYDEYTSTLVRQYVTFVASDKAGIGGSRSDYAADACLYAIGGHTIRLDEKGQEKVLPSLVSSIAEHALYPSRELGELRDAGVFDGVVFSQNLDSSFVRSASYDMKEERLTVTLGKKETPYTYDDVPYGIYHGLVTADSAGQYYSQNIKGRSDFMRSTNPLDVLRGMGVTPF